MEVGWNEAQIVISIKEVVQLV